MAALLMTLALATQAPASAAPVASGAPAEAMKNCCANMKAEGKDCCCCKEKGASHGDQAPEAEKPSTPSGEHHHAH